MRSHVVQFARAVAGGSHYRAVADDRRSDRRFPSRAGRFGFRQRAGHEARRSPRHLASAQPLC
jgi:hypothetical protein